MNLGNKEGSFRHSSLVIQKRGQVCSEAEEVECLSELYEPTAYCHDQVVFVKLNICGSHPNFSVSEQWLSEHSLILPMNTLRFKTQYLKFYTA